MRLRLLSCAALGLASLSACILMLVTGASGAWAASLSANSFESPAVRQEIARQLQAPGPSVVTQGGSGGTAEPAGPAGGELVPSLSTSNSNTWRVPRRPMVSRIYAAPVNYKGADGAWHAISNGLVPAALGGYKNEANSFSLQIPMSLSSGVSLTSAGRSVGFSLKGARESLPSVSGNRASYAEALASTDFEYASTSDGVQETATLKSASAPEELRFALSVSAGLQARQDADGSIALVDGQGDVSFRIPAPLAYRPGGDPGSGGSLASTLSASGSGWVLSIDTSEPWLRAELATGPVAVDPSIEIAGSQNCTIESDAPKTSACTQETFDVGYQSEAPAHEHHGLLQFSLSSLPSDVNVVNAKLGLYLQSKSTTNAKPVGVYRVTPHSWTTSATWETYDGTHAWTTPGGDYSNPPEGSDASVNPSVGGSTGWQYWYPTKMVQEWANGPSAPEQENEKGEKITEGAENDGLIVKDEKDNEINNVLQFNSIHASSHKPFLEVTYEPRGIGSEPQFTMLNTKLTSQLSMGVNVASGDLMLQNQTMHIPGRGADFSNEIVYNNLNPEVGDYGRWGDSGFMEANEQADGSVMFGSQTNADFVFFKQGSGYVTPLGIKAKLCTAGNSPCPATLPTGTKWRLIYNQSQEYIDFASYGWPIDTGDRYGNVLKAGFTEGIDRMTSWTDTEGRKVEYATKAEYPNYPTELKDIAGARHDGFEYEGTGTGAQLIAYTDANGHTTHYQYESYNLTKITTPKGNVIKLAYNEQHRIKEIIRTTNSEHTKGPTTKFEYLEVGKDTPTCTSTQKATVVKDPDWTASKAHETTYCANVLDEVEKTVNAEGKESKATFDPFGNQTSATEPAHESGGSNAVTSLVYGEGGQNLGCEVQAGEKAVTKCPESALKEGFSNGYKYKDTNFVFQPSEALSARQKATKLCYWGGSVECTGSGSGEKGELKLETDPLSSHNTQSYGYGPHGEMTSSTDPLGHITTYEYDSSGNLKTVIPPSGSGLGKETITVDADSRPHTVTQCLLEPGGTCTSSETSTLTYDKLDQVTEAIDTGPGATKTFKYTYDADANVEKRVDPTGTTKFTLDPLNRLTEESLPSTATNSYSYDEASNLLSFTDAGGTLHYFYNGLNKLEAMYEPGGNCTGTPSKCINATYDGAGSLSQIKYPSGATLNYTVNPIAVRPTVITAKNPKGEALLSNSYSYLSGTNDTPLAFQDAYSAGATTNTTTYEYDPLDRLTEATTTGTNKSHYLYELDGAGNRTYQQVNPTESTEGTKTYFKYNAGNELECRMKTNELCSKSSASELSGYSYDGAGDETAITGYGEAASTAFSYNNLSQLKSLTPPSTGEESVTNLGSGQSNLVALGSNTLQNSALGLTKQVNEAGTSYYARTPGGLMVDERLPGGTNYNPIYDAQGDVIGLLNSSGELVQTVRYGPYGENTNLAGSAAYTATNDPFLFQGGYHLAGGNTGTGNVPNNLYHFGERYYDPTTGRWTQQDPLKQPLDPTEAGLYQGLGGDPINLVDPTGEPGVPAGYECAGNFRGHVRYEREHPQICREIRETEDQGEEVTGDLCQIDVPAPIVKQACKIKGDVDSVKELIAIVEGL